MIIPPELPINDEARNDAHFAITAQVCGFNPNTGLPHQKTKRESGDASKSQLKQVQIEHF